MPQSRPAIKYYMLFKKGKVALSIIRSLDFEPSTCIMSNVNSEKYFFQFMLYSSSNSQKKKLLKDISNEQYSLLKSIANDILDEIIPLNRTEYNRLVPYKDFIRQLGRKRVSKAALSENIIPVVEIIKVAAEQYDICEQSSFSTPSRMGKSEASPQKEHGRKDNRCAWIPSKHEDTDDEEDEEIWDDRYNIQSNEGSDGETSQEEDYEGEK